MFDNRKAAFEAGAPFTSQDSINILNQMGDVKEMLKVGSISQALFYINELVPDDVSSPSSLTTARKDKYLTLINDYLS